MDYEQKKALLNEEYRFKHRKCRFLAHNLKIMTSDIESILKTIRSAEKTLPLDDFLEKYYTLKVYIQAGKTMVKEMQDLSDMFPSNKRKLHLEKMQEWEPDMIEILKDLEEFFMANDVALKSFDGFMDKVKDFMNGK